MFLADTLEPTARAIADLIVQSGAPISGAWNGYVKEEDLIPLRQTQDDVLEFTRAAGKGDHKGYARLKLFNIHSVDPDPETLVFHPPVVKSSISRADAFVEIDNLNGLTQAEHEFHKTFSTGESEENAVTAGFSVTSTTEIGTGQASPYKFDQTFSATVSSEWNKRSGRNKSMEEGGRWPLYVLPQTKVTAFLSWAEEDRIMQVDCIGTYDFGIQIGRRAPRRKRWRWYSGNMTWDSLNFLLLCARGKGSVHMPLAEYWYRNPPHPVEIHALKKDLKVPITKLIETKGAAAFKINIATQEDNRPEAEVLNEEELEE